MNIRRRCICGSEVEVEFDENDKSSTFKGNARIVDFDVAHEQCMIQYRPSKEEAARIVVDAVKQGRNSSGGYFYEEEFYVFYELHDEYVVTVKRYKQE
jgi:hypothetical protein